MKSWRPKRVHTLAVTFDTFSLGWNTSTLEPNALASRCVMSGSLLENVQRLKQKGWRRRYPRYRVDFAVKFTALGDDGYAEIHGRCGDIGCGGMGVVLTGEIKPGEVVSIEFALPASLEPMSVRAIIRYQTGSAHGLEFLGLSNEQREAVERYCAGHNSLNHNDLSSQR